MDNCLIRDNDYGVFTCNAGTTITTTTISGNTQYGVSSRAQYLVFPGYQIEGLAFLNLDNSVIRDNGHGVRHDNAVSFSYSYAYITDTTISGNEGDGVLGAGRATTVRNSTINANGRYGVVFKGRDSLINSTVTGNTAGGIATPFTEVIISQSTISGNAGPGLSAYGNYAYYAVFHAENSIVANNPSGNCWDASLGHNLSSDDCESKQPTDITNTDPMLLPLADNGGPTPTHALVFGSPAIDAGRRRRCEPTDQRGVVRPQEGDGDGIARCDIGAFELKFPQLRPSSKPSRIRKPPLP